MYVVSTICTLWYGVHILTFKLTFVCVASVLKTVSSVLDAL